MNASRIFLTILAFFCGAVSLDARQSTRVRYNKISPIKMPKELPSMDSIAQTITAPIEKERFLFGASTSEHQCSKQCIVGTRKAFLR